MGLRAQGGLPVSTGPSEGGLTCLSTDQWRLKKRFLFERGRAVSDTQCSGREQKKHGGQKQDHGFWSRKKGAPKKSSKFLSIR